MVRFNVIEIIDGDTIKVSPRWKVTRKTGEELTGDYLRVFGYTIPAKGSYGFDYAKAKLTKLLLGKNVILKRPIIILPENENKNAFISCRVILNDVDISYYFPEFKVP